jgi:hypothetical protein
MTDENKEGQMPLTTVRLKVKESKNARVVRMKIRKEDKTLGQDLRKRDYRGAEHQSGLIESNAKVEANEDRRLSSLQSEKRDRLLDKKKQREGRKRDRELKKHRCTSDEYWVDTYAKDDGTLVNGHCAKLPYDPRTKTFRQPTRRKIGRV